LAGRARGLRVLNGTSTIPAVPSPRDPPAGQRTMPRIAPWTVIPLAIALGCSRTTPQATDPTTEPTGPPWFEDVTAKLGITFRQQAGPTGSYFMPQVMGSGVAVIDVDNDGRFDLLFLNNAGPGSGATHKLFRQNPDGTFRDASAGSGI